MWIFLDIKIDIYFSPHNLLQTATVMWLFIYRVFALFTDFVHYALYLSGGMFMNQTYMKEKPILPLLLSMALPMVISMMVNSLYNIVDSYFVARISEEAMTALSLVYPIQNFITSVGVGFGIGINAAIAFFLGAQDQKKADAAATQGLFLSVIHGIVLTVVTIAIMPLFLQIFTKDVTVIQMGNAYSRIAFGFSIVISLEITWEKFSRQSDGCACP